MLTGCNEAQSPVVSIPKENDWLMYRGDFLGTGYSPLEQVNTKNVSQLNRSWTYSIQRIQPDVNDSGPRSQVTPIVIDGVMYLPAADRVVALDATTGQELWRHVVDKGVPSRRGVAYMPGENVLAARIIFSTGSHLVSIKAVDGTLIKDFGQGGFVDLGIPYNSVPLIFENIIVVGANTPRGQVGGIGNARAYDANTGKKLWEFSSVAQPGTVGHDTWHGESWKERLGANAWPFYFTVDPQSGVLYLPLASPIPGWYGGDREGANLFGNSVVAVDIYSGEYRWHFQTIRHDIWDHDPPAPPVLFNVNRDGQLIPALAVSTKSGYLYILNRETGEPIFGVEEREVPTSDVPGEITYPTQPFPIKPSAMGRVTYEAEDLVTADDTSPEHATACQALVDSLGEIYNAGPFTPWVYRESGAKLRTTLNFPGVVGGPNWGGVAYDVNKDLLVLVTQNIGQLAWMEDADGDAPVPYEKVTPNPTSFDVDVDGERMPCQKPPWGELIAVKGATGDIAWRQPLGITKALPAGKQQTGRPARAATIMTGGGLLFVAASDDNRCRAFETATGHELWAIDLAKHGNANPLTYLGQDGRQYVTIVATDEVMTFSLP